MKTFGIKTIMINDLIVYTTRIRISSFNAPILGKYNVPFTKVTTQRGKELCEVLLTTLDQVEHIKFSQKVGNALKEIAQNKVYNKYLWVSPLELTETQIKQVDKLEESFDNISNF